MLPVGHRRLVTLLAVAGLAAAMVSAAPIPVPAGRLIAEVKTLSAPEMDGRAAGTPGNDLAARHLAAALREAGLRPADPAGYGLPFAIPTRVRLGDGNRLALAAPAERLFALGVDWTPVSGSADGPVGGELVFVGYGISAPDLGWDDYAGVEARGRIVLALGGEPRRADPSSPFAAAYAAGYGQLRAKARAARGHGARALLWVSRLEADTLPRLDAGLGAGELVTAAITRGTADRLLAAAGEGLEPLRARVEATLAPASHSLAGVRVDLAVRLRRDAATTDNVVALLPGTDPALAREAVVVGAHYDALGRTGEGSLDEVHPSALHPGADDNASGTAAVIELARAFAAAGGTPRTLVFALFSAEEMGMLGSAAYVRQPPVPLERTVAMVNLDMIGRLRQRRVYVNGTGSGVGLERLVRAAAAPLGLRVELGRNPWAPSDQIPFYEHGVPVLLLHTGGHDDYHRPTDTWDRIDPDGLARVAALAERVIDRLARDPAPVYAKVPAGDPAPARGAAPGRGGYLGVAASPGDEAPGVRLSAVQPASAAARAGIAPGDIVVRVAGLRVYTFEELRESLAAHAPGDPVEVVYLRDGHVHAVHAVIGARP
jgi:peptidase M28-like protein/PDZ domain-containing protein